MATDPNNIPACPSQMAVLHAAYEEAWHVHNRIDVSRVTLPRRGLHYMSEAALEFAALKSDRLSLAILASQPSNMDDLTILAVHLAMSSDSALSDCKDRIDAVQIATETVLAFVLGLAKPPAGEVAAHMCRLVADRTAARMVGDVSVETGE